MNNFESINDAKRLAKKSHKLSNRQKTNVEPKFFANGRLDRKKYQYIAKSLFVLEAVEKQIKNYCQGNETVILNYLIIEGLRKVCDSNSIISIDAKEIEEYQI